MMAGHMTKTPAAAARPAATNLLPEPDSSMTSKQIKIMAIVLLALAALLALMARQVGRKPHEPAAPVQAVAARHPVVVTAKAIEAGKPVPADALKVEMLPIEPADPTPRSARWPARCRWSRWARTCPCSLPICCAACRAGAAGERAVAINVDEMVGVGNRPAGRFRRCLPVLRRDNRRWTAAGRACCCRACACWPMAPAR